MGPIVSLRRLRAALPIALLLCAGAVAMAQTGSRQTASAVFDEQQPGRSTGARLAIDYFDPGDSQAKPPAVQKVVTRLHPGTSIDTSVPARCAASDPELTSGGASACPPASRVGGGEIDLDTGTPGPGRILQNDVTLLNNKDELVFLLESKSEPRTRFVSRATISGTTLTNEVPPVPGGPPDGFLAIKRVRLSVQAVSAGRRAYLTTPGSCPAGGNWTNTATFTYRDGVSQTVSNRTPCSGTSTGGKGGRRDYKRPRIRVGGVPRRRCARHSFRARVRIAERWSGLRRAQLYLDGRRRLVTKAKRFSRVIRIRGRRVRVHRLTVIAVDNAGNRSVKRARFRTCARPGR